MMQHPRYFENTMSDQENTDEIASGQKEYVPVLLQIINKNCPSSPENCEGALYVGAAGIAYAFYHVAQSGLFDDKKEHFLSVAEKYIKASLRELKKVDPARNGVGSSLMLGHAGIYIVASLIYEALGLHNLRNENVQGFFNMHKYCVPLNFFKHGSDELFVGRAGYLAACFMVNKRFGRIVVSSDIILPLCNTIIDSGRRTSKMYAHECPLVYHYYDTEYIGAGHGLASILLMLLNFPVCYTLKPDVEGDIRESVDFILSAKDENGNYPPVLGETRDDWNDLVHWCHGASGVVFLMAKAYLVWKDEKYLQAALHGGELVWKKGLLRKGPGICHGIAGGGYVFLLLYRLTGDEKHLRRARQFAAFMQTEEFKANSRVPDAPYSLFEGIAGTACFLVDLVSPNDGYPGIFPFMDVF